MSHFRVLTVTVEIGDESDLRYPGHAAVVAESALEEAGFVVTRVRNAPFVGCLYAGDGEHDCDDPTAEASCYVVTAELAERRGGAAFLPEDLRWCPGSDGDPAVCGSAKPHLGHYFPRPAVTRERVRGVTDKQNRPNPGSRAAIAQGCICAVMDNNHGQWPPYPPNGWWMRGDCPLHFPTKVDPGAGEGRA